jgi:hypothetical protein
MKLAATIRFALALLLVSSFARGAEIAQLEIGGGKIEVNFPDPPENALRELVLAWVTTSAKAVTVYYLRFPVSHVRIVVQLSDGKGIEDGLTTGWNGPRIRLSVGRKSTAADFRDDWMLTHEMIHLAFPSVPDQNHWMEEGLSTYVEPIARARAGDLAPEKVWGDLVQGLPKGLPRSNDKGLDFTPTWGRTYWGGALFCLLADIEIHKRTQNKKGLEDALRAILNAGGTIEADWPISRVVEIGDRATGTSVLRELYAKMKDTPSPVDLDALWKQLGVESHEGRTTFRDNAPLAGIRKAITR